MSQSPVKFPTLVCKLFKNALYILLISLQEDWKHTVKEDSLPSVSLIFDTDGCKHMLIHTRITHRHKMKCMRLTHTLRRTSARRECLCTLSPLCTVGCSCCRTPLLLVRALVRRANFPHPEHRHDTHSTFTLDCTDIH